MKILHPKETLRFEPPDQAGRPEARRIAYHLRTPSLYDRIALERAVAEHGGKQHGTLQLLGALRRGVEQIMEDSEAQLREAILSAIDHRVEQLGAVVERLQAGEFDITDDEGASTFLEELNKAEAPNGVDLEAVARELRGAYQPFDAMMGDNEVYWSIYGIEAARLLLVGWDGIPVTFTRDKRRGVPEPLLEAIPAAHFPMIGARAQAMMRPSRGEEKNSDSPSSIPSDAPTSTAASTPPQTNP